MDRRNQPKPSITVWPYVLMLAIMTGIWLAATAERSHQMLTMQPQERQHQFVMDRVQYAVEALKKGDTGGADKAIADAVQIQGGTSAAVIDVTEELLRYDQADYAAYVLDKATKQEDMGWDPVLWTQLAKAEERRGNKDAVKPARTEAEKRAAVILKEIGTQSPVEANRPDPKVLDTILHLVQAGMYFSDIHRSPEDAFKVLREAYRLWPDRPEIQNALGYTLVDIGTTPKEIDEGFLLTKQAAQNPQFSESGFIRDSYGWALYRKGELTGARRILREAVDLEPSVPEIHYHLGVVYAKLGMGTEAELEFTRALDLRPDYTAAAEAKTKLTKPSTPTPQPTAP